MFRILIHRLRAFNFASVAVINSRGSVIPQDHPIAVKFPAQLFECVTEGSVWEVNGTWDFNTYQAKSGKEITEKVCVLSVANPICPEGQALAVWIEKNIPGIGIATAIKLTRGIKDLKKVVISGDIDTLLKIDGMSESKAHALLMEWPDPEIYDAISFLNSCGLPPKLAAPITKIYGRNTEKLIREDPYLLVPLGIPFIDVEKLIIKLGIKVTSENRESALAEDIVHSRSMNGSTIVSLNFIKKKAQSMGYKVSNNIAEHAVKQGTLIPVGEGYQTIGMAKMEAIVGYALARFLDRPKGAGALNADWEHCITHESILDKLSHYERTGLGFELTPEQREAVIGSVLSPVSCISGGAGVGKTTILKAILGVYESFNHNGMVINLMALSGRAAIRMSQSTGYPAITIAKFIYDKIRNSTNKKKRSPVDQCLIVIDEASMVDLHSMYRMIDHLPEATRIVFVGDTSQLPPVGGGLIFHEIVKTRVPTYHLTAVKRQSEDSGIYALATHIRNGDHDKMSLDGFDDVDHHPEPSLELIERIWHSEGGAEKAIILSPTNTSELGVDVINTHIQRVVGLDRPRLHFAGMDGSKTAWRIKDRYLCQGDQVVVTQNDYRIGIRNGDLATITAVYTDFEESENGYVYGTMALDGETIQITNEVIEKLDLGYAITIHKSQGSQWPTAIVVLSVVVN